MISLADEASSHGDCAVVGCQPASASSIPLHKIEKENQPRIDTNACFPVSSDCSIDTDATEQEASESSRSYSSCLGEECDFSGLLTSTVPTTTTFQNPSSSLREDCGVLDDDDDSSSATSSDEVGTKTMIRFAAEIEYRDTLRRLDYSAEETVACWYTANEYYVVQREAQDLIDVLDACGQAGLPAVDDDDSLLRSSSPRGLENLLQLGAESCNRNIALGMKAVFVEQERQQQVAGGIHWYYDDMAIAKQYRKVSLRCRFPARNMALRDRDEAQQCC